MIHRLIAPIIAFGRFILDLNPPPDPLVPRRGPPEASITYTKRTKR